MTIEPATDTPKDTPVDALFKRIDRRLQHSRYPGRDVEELFGRLFDTLHDNGAVEPSIALASKLILAASLWQERHDAHQRSGTPHALVQLTAEVGASMLLDALRATDGGTAADAESIIPAFQSCLAVDRQLIAHLVAVAASPALLTRLDEVLTRDYMRISGDISSLLHMMQTGAAAPPTLGREYALFISRVRARLGLHREALAILEREPSSDPRVLERIAEVLVRDGQLDEALERYKRALLVAREPARIRERAVELCLTHGRIDAAIEHTFALLDETGDIMYWYILTDAIGGEHPDAIERIRGRLRDRSLALYVEVLIGEGDSDAVATASEAKTFAYEQLWRMGDFLAPTNAAVAVRLYERAIMLQGNVAHSRSDCADLANRMEGVLPFFESIGRATKPRRLAREVVSRSKNAVPLKREFERVFNIKF